MPSVLQNKVYSYFEKGMEGAALVMSGKIETGEVLFIGGPLNFAWVEIPYITQTYKWRSSEYHVERLTLSPRAGEIDKQVSVPLYVMDGISIDSPAIINVIRAAVLRKFGFIES